MIQSRVVSPYSADVYERLSRAQTLARLVSDDPMTMSAADDGGITALRRGRVVAVLHDSALVEFLERAPAVLRALSEALGTVYADHRADDGDCQACGQPAPCRTRQVIAGHLVGRPDDSARE